jgi:Ca-activated chloride channel family protein
MAVAFSRMACARIGSSMAAARAELIQAPTGTPVSGRSLLMAMDASASMRSAHLGQQSAMAVIRHTARDFILGRRGDRIGLVLFGSEPYVQAPLSFDLQAVAHMADEVLIGVAGEGTALGDALALSVGRLRSLADETRVLVLLTDGSNTSGVMTVREAITRARVHQVRVYTIGIGVANARPGKGLDEEVLRSIADGTGGQYFHAGDAVGLERIYLALDQLESLAESASHHRVAEALYHWPPGGALALVMFRLIISALRSGAKLSGTAGDE